MSEKILKKLATHSSFLMIIVLIISFILGNKDSSYIYANNLIKMNELNNENQHRKEFSLNHNLKSDKYDAYSNMESENELSVNDFTESDKDIKLELNEKYIILGKPKNQKNISISIKDLYMTNSIRIIVNGLESEYYNYNSIIRVNQADEYIGVPIATNEDEIPKHDKKVEQKKQMNKLLQKKDIAKSINIQYDMDKANQKYIAVIDITLDNVYVHTLYQDKDNFYINLSKPKDVYDKILVIDAGHGGNDTGSISSDMKYYEKDFNLSIVTYLKEFLDQEKIKVYYTRLSDEKIYLNPRVNLANNVDADFFISVHCNASEITEASGTEVLFHDIKNKSKMNSKSLAKICLDELVSKIGIRNRGLVKGDNIYIIHKSKVPIALIEVAYISNKNDLKFLMDDNNQKIVAEAIYQAILKSYNILDNKNEK